MQYDEYEDNLSEESPESQIDNDEISPEEEGFMKGYEEGGDYDSDFDLNSED